MGNDFIGSPEDYYASREQETRLTRIALVKAKLSEAARQLEYWRQQDILLHRQLQELENQPETEQRWLGNE